VRQYTTAAGHTARLKDDSVEVEGTWAQERIIDAAAPLYEPTDQELVITSGSDGQHMTGSLHYSDEALDLRIWDLDDPARVAAELQAKLGEDFDVVFGPSHDTHIHAEYDPR